MKSAVAEHGRLRDRVSCDFEVASVRPDDMNSTTDVNDLFFEGFRTDPYWWDDVARPEPGSTVPPAEADVVIIGSGYTGLSAALQTLRGGRSTVVLDADTAGWGLQEPGRAT